MKQTPGSSVNMVEVNGFWLLENDKKCRRTFNDRGGIQVDHLRKVLELVTDWSIAIDGGAHVGSWARLMAEKFKEVHSFEMVPETYACLEKNVGYLKNVKLHLKALGEANRHMGINREGSTLSHHVSEGDDVEMVAIDSLNLSGLGLLKLDLEGYEYHALQGAKQTIQKYWPVIILEEKGHANRYGLAPDICSQTLKSWGYQMVWRAKPDKIFTPPKPKSLRRMLVNIRNKCGFS